MRVAGGRARPAGGLDPRRDDDRGDRGGVRARARRCCASCRTSPPRSGTGPSATRPARRSTTRTERDLLDLFGLLGELVPVEERLMDAATAISGCGPAFFALVVEALTDAGVQRGPRPPRRPRGSPSRRWPGTAELLRSARRRRGLGHGAQVTSPGGVTAAGRRGARASTACARRSRPPSRRSCAKAEAAPRRRERADERSCSRRSTAPTSPTTSNALFLVYMILIFARILLSWIPRIPYNPVLSAVDRLHPRGDRPVPEPLPARSCRRSAAAASRST